MRRRLALPGFDMISYRLAAAPEGVGELSSLWEARKPRWADELSDFRSRCVGGGEDSLQLVCPSCWNA